MPREIVKDLSKYDNSEICLNKKLVAEHFELEICATFASIKWNERYAMSWSVADSPRRIENHFPMANIHQSVQLHLTQLEYRYQSQKERRKKQLNRPLFSTITWSGAATAVRK